MKKLVILSSESIFSGCAQSGIAEVADSLANTMTENYAVSLVVPDGNGTWLMLSQTKATAYMDGVRTCKLMGVQYYLVDHTQWTTLAPACVDTLSPDILHILAEPEMLERLSTRPARCIYTIDQKDFVKDKAEYLKAYNAVTTVSRAYAEELLNGGDELATVLADMDFQGITNGILYAAFQPEKGLLVEKKYSSTDLSGKVACKKYLCEMYGLPEDRCIYLLMCRLVRDKGVGEVLDAVEQIRDSGGFLIVAGQGDLRYEHRLKKFTRSDGVFWTGRYPNALQTIPLLSGADFLLNPSISEPCGLQPLHATRFGCVPIVTLNGGLADNMVEEIAIIVGEDGMSAALSQAAELYADTDALNAKRAVGMERDFSWTTRKGGYIELYEQED